MRKLKNKGFTLAELLIIVAVIAILVSVIAANLFKYIEKSQATDDIASAEVIRTAVQSAFNDSEVNKVVMRGSIAGVGDTDAFWGTPGVEFQATPALATLDATAAPLVASTVNEYLGTLPEFKLKKPMGTGFGAPAQWWVKINYADKKNVQVAIYIRDSSGNEVQVVPEADAASLYSKYAK